MSAPSSTSASVAKAAPRSGFVAAMTLAGRNHLFHLPKASASVDAQTRVILWLHRQLYADDFKDNEEFAAFVNGDGSILSPTVDELRSLRTALSSVKVLPFHKTFSTKITAGATVIVL